MDKLKSILIVDDSEENVDILCEFLEEKYDLFASLNGEDALEIANEEKIDLILLDIMMPGLDGFEVCKRLKENDKTKNIPIIFITAKTDEASIVKAYNIGGIDYISKPFRVVEILSRISTHIQLAEQKANLEKEVQQEVEKNLQQKLQLFESSRMASMGEMIGNIAHQWRQPLSAISMLLSTLKIEKEMGILEDKDFYKKIDDSINYTEQLSNTVETFRNFLKGDKSIQKIDIQDIINKTLDIVSSTLRNHNIRIHHNMNPESPIYVTIVPDELTQVIMNIINNAKDVLASKEPAVLKPWINIQITKDDNKVLVSIEDNGGGIPESILPKIFDPYFTTKHQSQGTGLGLHMSYKIITESFYGKLYAKNTNNGANFFIEIPLS